MVYFKLTHQAIKIVPNEKISLGILFLCTKLSRVFFINYLREKDVLNNNYMYLSSSTIASFKKKKKKLSVALTGENVHKMQLKPSGYTYTFTL